MKHELKHPLCEVNIERSKTYGGSQMFADSKNLREVGCGVVAAQELFIYLCRYHGGQGSDSVRALAEKETVSPQDYVECSDDLRRKYFPLIPKLGVNGISLVLGINAYFALHKMPFRADWEITEGGLIGGIEKLLEDDMPVIMAIGPNFPKLWKKNDFQIYIKNAAGEYVPDAKVRGHYVLAAAIDGGWIRISSWGSKYYINIGEYKDYVSAYSSYLVSNYVRIRRR